MSDNGQTASAEMQKDREERWGISDFEEYLSALYRYNIVIAILKGEYDERRSSIS